MTNELQGVLFYLERIEARQKLIEAALEVLRPPVIEEPDSPPDGRSRP